MQQVRCCGRFSSPKRCDVGVSATSNGAALVQSWFSNHPDAYAIGRSLAVFQEDHADVSQGSIDIVHRVEPTTYDLIVPLLEIPDGVDADASGIRKLLLIHPG
nr:hypothetical protein [Mesorhizobium sp. M4B.F.Ca.ET.058.02.1.1]